MKVVFMGTPDFAVPCLKALLEDSCDVVGVVSQPDRPKGRGRNIQPTPVATVASAHNRTLFQWPKLNNESFAALEALEADLFIVVAYGKILPRRYLELPKRGCWNIHASILPKLRGAAPIQWALINGETETGVSLMQLDEGMDTGPVGLINRLNISETDTAATMHERLSHLGAQTLKEGLEALRNDTLEFSPQNHQESTHARPLEKLDGHLDWSLSSADLWNRYRGMTPWPGCSVLIGDERIKFKHLEMINGAGETGTIIGIEGQSIDVACGSGAIRLHRVQRPNRGPVTGAEFLRSLQLTIGDRLR